MATAQPETYDAKKEFNNTLVEMMDTVDEVMESYKLIDADYMKLLDGMMKLRGLYDRIKPNTVYITIERQVREPRAERKAPPSLEEKMTSDKYEWCEYCNTPIKIHKKGYFKKLHLQTAKCSQIAQTKRTTIKKPIFKNVDVDMPLQVLNRCVWKKLRKDYKISAQRDAINYYEYDYGGFIWEKHAGGKWFADIN